MTDEWLKKLNREGAYVVFKSHLIGEEISVMTEEDGTYSACRYTSNIGEWQTQNFPTADLAMGCAQLMCHFAERLHDFVKYGEEVITD